MLILQQLPPNSCRLAFCLLFFLLSKCRPQFSLPPEAFWAKLYTLGGISRVRGESTILSDNKDAAFFSALYPGLGFSANRRMIST